MMSVWRTSFSQSVLVTDPELFSDVIEGYSRQVEALRYS